MSSFLRRFLVPTPEQARKLKDKNLQKRYGITIEDWEGLLASQGFLCGCGCGKKFEPGKRWSVDHDHKTGEVRSITTLPCNRYFIGSFTAETAWRLYQYLTSPPARAYFGEARFVPPGMENPPKRRKRRVVKRRAMNKGANRA